MLACRAGGRVVDLDADLLGCELTAASMQSTPPCLQKVICLLEGQARRLDFGARA